MEVREYIDICKTQSTKLFELLREVIQGYIVVDICNDVVRVKITKGDFEFNYTEVCFYDKYIESPDEYIWELRQQVIDTYRSSIDKKYFFAIA